jgi:regulator of protease activity HflC (stomatin/prohibitin superfamily)
MFSFKYIKFDSMDYVIHYQNGKIKREGIGLAFFYFAPNSSIVSIPLKSNDLPFIFRETTSDYQEISVQGQLTYKIIDPKKLATQLDFTINDDKRLRSNDLEKLTQRLINEAQTATTSLVHATEITKILSKQLEIEQHLLAGLSQSKVLEVMGIEVQGVSILGIKASPEMSRALEAKTREELQKEADKAIYDRRNFAVEQERKIKESELNTEIAVEEKQKQIVEKKMETDVVKSENQRTLKEMEMKTTISIEQKNTELIKMKAENDKKMADVKEYSLKAVMNAYKDVDWKVLTALSDKTNDASSQIALAFRELAANTGKIGTLNITPELLDSLISKKHSK